MTDTTAEKRIALCGDKPRFEKGNFLNLVVLPEGYENLHGFTCLDRGPEIKNDKEGPFFHWTCKMMELGDYGHETQVYAKGVWWPDACGGYLLEPLSYGRPPS